MKNYASLSIETHLFFARIMKEHALFIRGLLDPSEEALVNTANDFAGDYRKLLALSEKMDASSNHSLAELSLAETTATSKPLAHKAFWTTRLPPSFFRSLRTMYCVRQITISAF